MDYFFTCEYLVEQNNHWLTAVHLKNCKLPEDIEIISKDNTKRCIVRFPDIGLPHAQLVEFCKAAAAVLDKKCLHLIPYKIGYDGKGNRILRVENSIALYPYRHHDYDGYGTMPKSEYKPRKRKAPELDKIL